MFPHVKLIQYNLHYTDSLFIPMVAVFDDTVKTEAEAREVIMKGKEDPDVLVIEEAQWNKVKQILTSAGE